MRFCLNLLKVIIPEDVKTNVSWLVGLKILSETVYDSYLIQTEMRFYVPNSNDGDDDDGSRRTVEILHQDIMKHVVLEATGAQVRQRLSLPRERVLILFTDRET